MPTYQITTILPLPPQQKQILAQKITSIHETHTGAPGHAVQVIFHNPAPYDHYHGGIQTSELATPLIWLLALNKTGRTQQVKQAILQDCRSAIVEMYGHGVQNQQVLGYEIAHDRGNHISSLSARNLKLKSKI